MTINHSFFFISAVVLGLLTACSPQVEEAPESSSNGSSPAPGSVPTGISESPRPAPTPPPALDPVWEDMPLPPTPAPTPVPVVPTRDPDQPVRYVPENDPEGRAQPIEGAVWRTGHLNGLPKDVESSYPTSEYPGERNFARTVHLRDPNRPPPFLESGQTLVIHLPPLPPDVYILHVASTGGTEAEGEGVPGFYSSESYNRRFLRIRFNDRVLWQRTVPPFHAITRVVLDPTRMNLGGNLITLENMGTHPLPLDAVWIAPHHPPDHPMFVALDRGEWLNRKDAGWVRTGVALVDVPVGKTASGEPGNPIPDLPLQRLAPVDAAEDLPAAWKRVGLRFRLLEELGHPDLDTLRAWAPPLRDLVDRGVFPILQLDSPSVSPRLLEAAASLFGDVVQAWILPRDADLDVCTTALRTHVPSVRVLSTNPSSPAPGVLGVQPRYFWQGFDLSIRDGRLRARVFSGGASPSRLPSLRGAALRTSFRHRDAYDPNWPGANAGWAHHSVAEWLMRRETPVLLGDGYAGGPYFPDGTDRAGDYWWWMKPLARFGSPNHRPGVANIVPERTAYNPVLLHWGVADNGTDSVQVVAHTSFGKRAGRATLELPVPWSGPTRLVHHATAMDWGRVPRRERETLHVDLEATELATPSSAGAKGWIRHTFQMRGMHVFEFAPAGQSSGRTIQAPERVGFAHLRKTQTLFTVDTQPPPSWWSRKEMGRHFSPDWRAAGPVLLQVNVDATRDGAPGWKALKGFHPLQPKTFSGVAPLSEKSTRFHFGEADPGVPRVMRMFFKRRIAPKADAVGLWIRAHRPPGFQREFDAFHANPIARFYMGKLPLRQLIEIEYDRWHFISSPARFWAESHTDFPPAMLFWPAEEEAFQPILEVNSFAAYRLSLEKGVDTPEKTLGFVRERKDGSLALLVVELPGKGAFWNQRLEKYIDPDTIRHVEDAPRVVSAESPDDPPPEEVRHDLTWREEARLLETHIPEMPPPPTAWYRKRIREDFPLIGYRLDNEALSAVLFNEVRDGEAKRK